MGPVSRRYQTLGLLGAGGMGSVWLCWDPVLEREVAVKQLRDDRSGVWLQRFRDEARVLARLNHPGIVPVFDIEDDPAGRPLLIMRRVVGRTLRERLEQADLPLPRALEMFERVCDAVGFAHRRGVLHRDLKPANIMIGDNGEVLVLDWGVARRDPDPNGTAEPGTTLPGSILGTPGYLAPEVAIGDVDAHGPEVDVFSLGATLFEILTGRPAVVGGDLLFATLANRVPPVRDVAPRVDPITQDTHLELRR